MIKNEKRKKQKVAINIVLNISEISESKDKKVKNAKKEVDYEKLSTERQQIATIIEESLNAPIKKNENGTFEQEHIT
jgi:hypothetical protein